MPWSCVCTLINSDERDVCEICTSPRADRPAPPTYTCPHCASASSVSEVSCGASLPSGEACGFPNPAHTVCHINKEPLFAVVVSPLRRFTPTASAAGAVATFTSAAGAVLSSEAPTPATPAAFVAFVRAYFPGCTLSEESFSPEGTAALKVAADGGGLARALRAALAAPSLFEDEGLLLPILPIPVPGAPPIQRVVALTAAQVDAALAFILFCVKGGGGDGREWCFPDLHTLKYPGTVAALLRHFAAGEGCAAAASRVTLTRTRVGEAHLPALLAASRALPPVEFVRSGSGQPVRVLFSDPLLGGGVLYKAGTQEEALLREAPALLAALPLTMRLESGDSVRFHRGAQEAVVLAAEGGPTLIALDAARFQVPWLAHADQFDKGWAARDAAKALAGFLGAAGAPAAGGGAAAAVSTAAWGCGTYKGDVALKFVLQWLAAAAAGVGALRWECAFAPASTFEERGAALVAAVQGVAPAQLWEWVCAYGDAPAPRGDFCDFLVERARERAATDK